MKITLLYLAIILFSCTQSAACKLAGKGGDPMDPLLFNALKSVPPFLFFLILTVPKFQMHWPTVGYSVLFSLLLCVSMHCGYRALCVGPMSLTSLIVSFSLIIPSLCGIVAWGEPVTAAKIIGFVLLFAALLFTNSGALLHRGNREDFSPRWAVYTGLTLVSNGVSAVVQKIHQTKYAGEYLNEFMLFATLTASILFCVLLVAGHRWQNWKTVRGKGYGVLAGLTNSGMHYLTLALAGMENASVLYPVISAGTIAASMLCGRFLFKEKQNVPRLIGFVLGITAVILLKI